MKRYETYKPSGIEWVGEIPEHWEVKRVKDLFKINPGFKSKNFDKDMQVSFTPMECLRCGQIEKRTIDYATALSYVPFKNNDILIAKVTPCFENGNIAIADDLENGIGFGSSEIYVIRSDERYINRKLAFYLFQSNYFRSIGISSMKGTGGLKRVDPTTLITVSYPYVSLIEQSTIANYLDTKTTAIDKKIELLTAKAAKYKALRRSLINETVCRGLNQNVPLKNSGVEWIGKIPEHWEVKRVKELFDISRGRVIGQEELIDEGKFPVYSSQTENNGCLGYINTYDFNATLLTWTTDGANAGTIFKRTGKFNCTNVCGLLKPKRQNFNLDFMLYVLQISASHNKRIDTNGAKIMSNEMSIIPVIYPPIKEQAIIATYLDLKTTQIDTILSNINEQITKLTQLRKTMINDVVTGKIKVT